MAILPYTVTLYAKQSDDLQNAEKWCRDMWECTSGATWKAWWTAQDWARPGHFHRSFQFQFKEDSEIFILAWDNLIKRMS